MDLEPMVTDAKACAADARRNRHAKSGFLPSLPAAATLLLPLVLWAKAGEAQPPDDFMTPLGLAPGAPAGSFRLDGFDTVNLFNGNLNFHLPLLTAGGRGEAPHVLALTIDQNWGVEYNDNPLPQAFPRFNWSEVRPGYGPGSLRIYRDFDESNFLTRMALTGPDETQYQLRDALTEGRPAPKILHANRGRIFKTYDGSQMVFESDVDIIDGTSTTQGDGFLRFPNGTTYRIDNGLVTYSRDRNGNVFTFSYAEPPPFHFPPLGPQVVQIRDPLLRTIEITYASAAEPFDKIRFRGFDNGAREIQVHYAALQDVLVDPGGARTLAQLFPEIVWGLPNELHNPIVASSVLLPNGQSYVFRYNAYGELAQTTLPTRGVFRYMWGAGHPSASPSGVMPGTLTIYRRVLQRSTVPDGDEAARTVFGLQQDDGTEDQYVDVEHWKPENSTWVLDARERHYYHGRATSNLVPAPISNPPWRHGKERHWEVYGSSGPLLRWTQQLWEQVPLFWYNSDPNNDPSASPANDPRVTSRTVGIETGQTALTAYLYGLYPPPPASPRYFTNLIETREFDFGGALKRVRSVEWVTDPVYVDGFNLRRLPLREHVLDSVGTVASRTTYEYDNYSTPLVSRPNLSGRLDPDPFGTSFTTRGNVTAVKRWLNTTNQDLVEQRQYDVAGNVVKVIDPRLNPTIYGFNDRFGLPDGIAGSNTNPIPNGKKSYAFASVVINASGHQAYTQRDYWTGQPVDIEDPNGVVTTVFYDDPGSLDRVSSIVRAFNNSNVHTRTRFFYDDNYQTVMTFADQDGYEDDKLRTLVAYDGLGRERARRTYEATADYIETGKAYDARGRLSAVSNPYRFGGPVEWTDTEFDALGRETSVTYPGGAKTLSAYAGNTATVTDPAGKVRRIVTDALGRVTSVVEDPLGLNYQTTYAHDVLDNLTQVTQGGQTRTFVYDSLSRLTSSTTPEAGTVAFNEYDGNGNLKRKTDARNVVTQYDYDPINRIMTRSYSDGTPSASYSYDVGAPPVPYSNGRLVSVTAGGTAHRFDEYDPLGHVLRSSQTTDGVVFSQSYTYDLADHLRSETYPSGRVVATTYDTAGRIATVQGAGASVGSITYTPHGAPNFARLGNGLWETTHFNMRLQPKWIWLGSSQGGLDLFEQQNNYGTTANNGNVWGQALKAQGTPFGITYTYDGANRLQTATENWGAKAWDAVISSEACYGPSGCAGETSALFEDPSATTWTQTYGHDRWGNHAVTAGTILNPALTPNSLSLFSTSTNRLNNSLYDNAGNQTRDASSRVFTYDGENRLASAPGATSYVYDGSGRRVKKVQGASTTTYVYNAFGRLAAEYCSPASACGALTGVRYVTTDHLGSTRVVSDEARRVVARHDYLPFGEEIPASFGGRSSIGGYGSESGVRQKFTGKERDLEAGLDYFGARYFSGAQGRFTGPDAPFADQSVGDAQSWNLYAYVRGNPLRFVDPSGRACFDHSGTASCAQYILGVGKAVGNIPSGLFNLPNRLTNAAISPFTDFRFPDLIPETFPATNIDQQEGMFAATIVMAVAPLAEAGLGRVGSLRAPSGAGRATTGILDDVTVVHHGRAVGRGPVDVRATLEAVESGKLSPRAIFENREGLLPKRAPGYYQEFVHPTAGVRGAGPQRIVRGQGGELYYTPDHYKTFVPLK